MLSQLYISLEEGEQQAQTDASGIFGTVHSSGEVIYFQLWPPYSSIFWRAQCEWRVGQTSLGLVSNKALHSQNMEDGEEGSLAKLLPFFPEALGLLDDGSVVAARRQCVFNVLKVIDVFNDLVNILLIGK